MEKSAEKKQAELLPLVCFLPKNELESTADTHTLLLKALSSERPPTELYYSGNDSCFTNCAEKGESPDDIQCDLRG